MATKTKQDALSEQRMVTLTAAKKEIRLCMKRKRPVFLWGPPGIGKSDLVAHITSEMKGRLYDLRLALMDPSDLKGVLYYNPGQDNALWSAPPDLPSKEEAAKYPIVVLFLDELNSAAPATQAAAYQLVLNRKVGTYELPDNCVVVAAGNRETDRGVVYRMPAPLANRFVHLNLKSDFDTWAAWAVDQQIDADVVGYLTNHKGDLMNFDPKAPGHAFPTPRSWTFVSELVQEAKHGEITENELLDLISGTVGEGTALKFHAHRKVSANLPNPTDILNGKVKKLENKDLGAMYSLTVSLCYELRETYIEATQAKKIDPWMEKFDNVLRFVLDNFEAEMIVMMMFNVLSQYNIQIKITKLKNFSEFHSRCGGHILEAMNR